MHPFLKALIGAGVRWVVTVAAAQGVMVTEDQTLKLVDAAVLVGMLAWSGYQKYKAHEKIESAELQVIRRGPR